jgi:hypothetical protein
VIICSFVPAIRSEAASAAPRGDGRLTIELVDSESGQPLAARMHVKNARGRAVTVRLPGTAEYGGHFYIDGRLTIPFRRGQYTFELDAGPEYLTQSGHFEIERHADDSKRISMKRFVKLASEGWYGGDLDVARRPADLPLIMRAEGLHILPTHEGKPSEVIGAQEINGRIIARAPYAWEMPLWLASGKLDAIQLIHYGVASPRVRNGDVDNEQGGRPRDPILFPGRSGNGRWSEAVYYHVLNCGLRIPPAAGSGSGTNDNPVGTNRVYVYCEGEYSDERWWEGLEAGRVFVTNGPLLRPMADGRAPGYVFRLDGSGPLLIEIGLDLATRVNVEYLQIVKNGRVEAEVRLADWKERKGRLPKVRFDTSGWFLVRAVTSNPSMYQFASSGPWYVEQAGRPRISRQSVQFFLDWIKAAAARENDTSQLNSTSGASTPAEWQSARQFFEELHAKANAE